MRTGADTYSSAIEAADNYSRWVLSNFLPHLGSSMLEVGFGHGGYRLHIPENIHYAGVDIDAAAISNARVRYPHDRFEIADISELDPSSSLTKNRFDSVLCINVLEHIDKDDIAVSNMLRLLNPGGHLLVLVPAFPSLFSKLDRMAGHYRRYTMRSLRTLVPEEVEVITCNYFNSLGGIGWWVNGHITHASLNDAMINCQIRFFDTYVLPIARSLDVIMRRYFGQSITMVVRVK